jgi:signal peptidase I
MTDDDWWAQAVEQFGLEELFEPESTPPHQDEAHKRAQHRRRRSGIVDWLVVAVVAVVVAVLLRVFIVQQFAVDGDSMLGSLHSGDRVLVNKVSYHLHGPRRGDIVVLKEINTTVGVPDLIKRVVGLPGETIEYSNCKLFINGNLVAEPYLDPTIVDQDHCGLAQPAVTVLPDHVFVMGDNRASSLDSRTAAIGQIPIDHIIGRAFVLIWPFSHWGWL